MSGVRMPPDCAAAPQSEPESPPAGTSGTVSGSGVPRGAAAAESAGLYRSLSGHDDGLCSLGSGFREVRPRLRRLEVVAALCVEAQSPTQIGALLSAVSACVPRSSVERLAHLKRVVKVGDGGGHAGVAQVLACLAEDYDAMDARVKAGMEAGLPPLKECRVPREGAPTDAHHREWSRVWPLASRIGAGNRIHARQSSEAQALWEAFEEGAMDRGGGGEASSQRREGDVASAEQQQHQHQQRQLPQSEPPGDLVAKMLLPDASERRTVRAGMRLALSLAREARREGRPGVGAVLYDRARGEVASCSGDRTTRRAQPTAAPAGTGAPAGEAGHPLGHAVMACIGASAAKYHVFTGSADPLEPGEQPRAKRLKNSGLSEAALTLSGRGANPAIRAVQDQYVCTGFDVFLSHEPCPMCAMALVHSRVARVFYAHPYPECGALGSVHSLHTIKSLNHSFQVFCGVLAGEEGQDLLVP